MLYADIVLNPGGVVAWVVVGLVAGFLAGRVMKGEGYGLAGDLVVGLVGALVGGFLFEYFVQGDLGLFGSILVAFLGACVLIFLVRSVRGSGPRL